MYVVTEYPVYLTYCPNFRLSLVGIVPLINIAVRCLNVMNIMWNYSTGSLLVRNRNQNVRSYVLEFVCEQATCQRERRLVADSLRLVGVADAGCVIPVRESVHWNVTSVH
jgi:hypothetical protein